MMNKLLFGAFLLLASQTRASAPLAFYTLPTAPCPLPAPLNPQVVEMNGGNMTWTWEPVAGALSYEVSVNGGPWQPASGNLSHTVTGLMLNDLVVIEIRGVSNDPLCGAFSVTANKMYVECTLAVGIDGLAEPLCFGTATGTVLVISIAAIGPVQFFLDGSTIPAPGGDFVQVLAVGTHQVAAHDAAGCRDTITFTLGQPPPLSVMDTVRNVDCNGTNSGALYAAASGGSPPYHYAWQGCAGGPIMPDSAVGGLFAGCYALTATDDNGCTATLQTTILEPPAYDFKSMQTPVRCFGGMDGTGAVTAMGATPPYTFKWVNGDTGPVADSLKAGFHSVTVTDALGCEAVTLVQVLEPTKLVIDSIATTKLKCFGGSDGKATAVVHGGKSPYGFLWSNMAITPAISNLTAGTYTVTVTDANGCTASFSAAVNAPPALQGQISNVQPETCAGDCNGSMSLTASGGTGSLQYTWSSPAIPNGTTAPQNLCPGLYTVTVSDANACTLSISETILPAPAIDLALTGTPPACAGDQNGNIAAVAGGGAGGFQFLWNTGLATPVLNNLSCGIFTVTATDAKGCTAAASDTLLCPQAMVLDSITARPVRCFGEANGSAMVAAHGGTGALNYQWNDPNLQIAPLAQFLPKGTYTVTVTDANGCSLTASATVAEPPALIVTLVPTHISCFGGSDGAVQATVSGGWGGYQYAWSVPSAGSQITDLKAGTYSLTVTDALGCPSSTSTVLVQPATPVTITAQQTRKACFGEPDGQALATASGSNGAPYQFMWSNDFKGPAPNNFSVGTYTVTATDGKGCSSTQTVTIQEWAKITAAIIQVPPTCRGGANGQAAVNLISGGAGGGVFENYHYFWSLPGVGDTVYVSQLKGGQPYRLTITDMEGCSVVLLDTLPDQVPIVATLTPDSVSCYGLADGGITVFSVQSPHAIAQYVWNTTDVGKNLTNQPAGTYTVSLTDVEGCTATATAQIFEPALLEVVLDVQSLICNIDSNAIIEALLQGGTSAYTYTWNTGAASARIDQLGPGDYALTVTDRNGCTTASATTISQPNPPTIAVEESDARCHGAQDGYFRLLVSDGTPPYRYRLEGEDYTGSSVFFGLGAGQYTAYVLDGKGCVTEASAVIGEPPPVEVELPADLTLTLGDSVLLSASVFNAVGPVLFSWRGALTDSFRCVDAECEAIWVFPTYSNTYYLTVTDAQSCRGEASIGIEVDKPRGAYVPTGFSPDGDGANDLLGVLGKGRQIVRVIVFQVFDRWGELVFEDRDFPVNDPQRGWDGRFRGQDSPAGVYVWHVEVEYLDGYEEALRGNSMLLR